MSVLQFTGRCLSVKIVPFWCANDPMKIRIGRLLLRQGNESDSMPISFHGSLNLTNQHSEGHIYSTQSLGRIIPVANYYSYYTATTLFIHIHQTQQHSICTTRFLPSSPYPSLAALPIIHAQAANGNIRNQRPGRKHQPRHW